MEKPASFYKDGAVVFPCGRGISILGKIAFVFPGQGAQQVGMGRDAYEGHEGAKQLFHQADSVLGYDLSALIFNGPEEELKLTYHTQPALLTTSMAYLEVLKDKGVRPDYAAGHSLGEYSALVAGGALSFTDAVSLVRKRGKLMDRAVPAGQGAMAAVLGAEREALTALCRSITETVGPVETANINCPGQIVVSGSVEGVGAVVARGKQEAGAKRVIPLEVSGPFHSSLMKPAADGLKQSLEEIELKDAHIPIVANVTAEAVTAADQIRSLLVEQVVSPVLWEDSVRWMLEQGVDTFVEIGSGNVLSGLIKKINRDARIITVNSMEAAESFATI